MISIELKCCRETEVGGVWARVVPEGTSMSCVMATYQQLTGGTQVPGGRLGCGWHLSPEPWTPEPLHRVAHEPVALLRACWVLGRARGAGFGVGAQ